MSADAAFMVASSTLSGTAIQNLAPTPGLDEKRRSDPTAAAR
eukprot:CAMPEP_0197729716 /NCGR_PEP_ID=MMETSP1434-20131217/31662_1 /TAXON_ID=265543 /ORGANISM="Minutocellus polymorphus, Strain CCMP3303" /LENGTH=41 /DNA_ID= /DNA_START= /DNA_END= /DNA_ORIENTATION=